MSIKRLLALLLSCGALFSSGSAWSASSVRSAEPMAILIAADWCINCKILEPKLKAALNGFEGKINRVDLDVTDDKHFFESKQVVFHLGVPKLLQGKIAVGWVALYDRYGNQVGKLMQDMSVDEMRQVLKNLSSSSAM